MKNANRNLFEGIMRKARATGSLRLAVVSALLFVNVFYTRAQALDAPVKINFPFDNAVLHTNYMSNYDALATLDAIAEESISSNTPLDVVSFSSPEGNYTYNLRLSQRRAMSVSDYLEAKYPGIVVNIVSEAESWDLLREYIQSDDRLNENSRLKLLEIVDSEKDPDSKEKLLKANSEYKRLYNSYFRGLRYAIISLRIEKSTENAQIIVDSEISENSAEQTNSVEQPKISEEQPKQSAQALQPSAKKVESSASGLPVVYYSKSEDFIRPGYMGNEANLREIRRILSDPANRDREIVLYGAASPEGPESKNDRLGTARAENLKRWLSIQFPDFEDRIVIRSKGEDWEGLSKMVENCESLDSLAKSEIIDIISSNETPAKKEAALKAHPSYKVVEDECLPYVRYSSFGGFEPVREKPAKDTTVKAPVLPVIDEPVISDTDEPVVSDNNEPVLPVIDDSIISDLADTVAIDSHEQDTLSTEPVKAEKVEYHPVASDTVIEKPILGVGTNLLYDLAITPNFSVDVPVSKHWSVMAEYTFPWWVTRGNDRAWEMLKWDIGARYWFKGGNKSIDTIFTGHYVGIDLSAGYYDVEPHHKGYQGEFQLAGLEYGYSWKLSRHWRMNVAIGAGWMGTHYRYYEATDDDVHLIYQNNGKLNWFGPTKAEVGVKYIFTHKQRRDTK